MFGKYGKACGDPANERKGDGPTVGRLLDGGKRGRRSVFVEDLKRARLGCIALDEAMFLKDAQVCMDGGGGGEPNRCGHFTYAGRIALLKLIRPDEVVDLLLTFGDLARHGILLIYKHLFEFLLTRTTVRT